MHTFRQKLISRFVGILCIFLLLFNQAMATVFSFPGVEVDVKQRLIRLLPLEENIDKTLTELTEALRLNAKVSDEKWFVCNQRALDVSFSVLHALNTYAPIFNMGVLNCVIDDTTESGDLDLFTLINTGATTFTDARRKGADQSHSDIALVFKHLMNDGSLSLQFEHTETETPIHWHVSAMDYLANTGIIQTSHQLTVHQKSTTNRLPLRGTINANGLKLKGFSEIDALLISGGGSSQQDTEEPSEEKTAPQGYIHVDATPHMQTNKGSDDSKPLNHPNFIWQGKVKSTEEATLDIKASAGEAVHAVIDTTFETTGLHVNVGSEKRSTVTFHPKMVSSQAENTGTFAQSNPLPQQSIFDGSGLSIAFTRPASEDSAGSESLTDKGRGDVSFGGRYAVSGDMLLTGANNVFVTPDSEITFDKNVTMDAKAVSVDGIFARTFNNKEHIFHTDADITVSETGRLYTPLFVNTKTRDNKPQIIDNKGTICLRALEQNRQLSVINKGVLEFKHPRGASKPVLVIDNTGVVQSALPIISAFSPTFFESHHRVDEKGLKTLPVKGSLSSKGAIEIDLEHTRGKRLDWRQSLLAPSIAFKDKSNTRSAPTTEIMLNEDAHLHAFNDDITLNIGKLTTLPGSILEAKRHVKLLIPSLSHLQNCVLHGHVKAPLLTIHQAGLSGTGILDIHTLITESINAVSVDLNQFRFGKHLSNISVQNKGAFTFRRDPKAQKSNTVLEMNGLFEVFAERIAMQTPLSVMRTIKLHATQSNDPALSLSTDLMAGESIGLESSAIHFSRDKAMSLISKNMSINQTMAPSFSVPPNVTLTVSKKETTGKGIQKEGGLLSIQSPQELHIKGTLSGETFSPNARSIFVGSGRKIISEKDAKESFNGFRRIEVDGKRFNSSLPIEADTVFARVESLALSDLHTKSFDIEAKNFASFGDLSSTKPSSLTTDHMNEANRTFRGFITFNGYGEESFHHLTNVDFDGADITQKESTLVMSGKSHGGVLRTGPVTSVPKESVLSVDEMDNPAKQKALLLNGTVDTKQAKFVTQAEKIAISNLLRTGGSGIFDTFIAQGETVEIQGGLKAKHALVEGREELRLKQAQLMGLIFYLRSKHKISIQHASADVAELGVEARYISMDDTTLSGKKHNIQAEGYLRTSHTMQNVSETSSLKAKHYEMSHSAISAKDVDVVADSASLEPRNIKASTATIKLEQYDNGIEGVIKLAHDLLHCERVHLDARKETLVITKAAPWRRNISLVVRSGDIQAPITSAGDVEIEAEQGIKINGSIHAHNINLTANHGDLEFYKAVLDAMEDLTYEAHEGNIHGQAGTYKAGNILKGGADLGDVTEKSITERVGDSENYHTRLTQSSYTGRKIILYAGGTLHFASVRTHSKELTAFHATTFIDDALRDERGTSWQHGKERKSESSNTAIRSHHTSGGTHTVFTHGEQHHVAPIIDAHQIKLDGGQINLYNTQNIHQSEYSNQTKRKKESESSYSSTSVGATLKARMTLDEAAPGEAAIMITGREGGINATHARFDSSKTILSACDNTIRLMQGMNQSSYSRTMSYNSVAWNHMKSHQENHTTYSPCQFTGLLETYCDQLIVQQVEGQPLDFMSRLDAHGAQIAYEYLKEVHHIVKLHVSAPSQASIAIVGLAMSAATAGVGTSLMGAATAAGAGSSAAAAAALETLAAMSHAAITTLSTQASVALMSNDGNLGKALDSLNHSSTFKSLIASAVSAGIMHNVSLGGTGISDYAKAFAVRTGINAGTNSIMGQNFEKSLTNGAISAAYATATSAAADMVSYTCQQQNAADFVETAALSAASFGVSTAFGGNRYESLASAIGAAVGSISAKVSTAKPTEDDETGGKLTEEQKQANKTSNARPPYFAQIDAILLTMALDISEYHSQAAQAAGATFSAVRMTQERIKKERKAEEQARINAEKIAEAEKAYQEQIEAEEKAKKAGAKQKARAEAPKRERPTAQQRTVAEGGYLGSDKTDNDVKVSDETIHRNGEKVIPHKMNGTTIYLQVSEEEYKNYQTKYKAWEQKDYEIQKKIDDRVAHYERSGYEDPWSTVEVQALSNQRVFNRFARPNTPPRALGRWSDGNTKNHLKQAGHFVSEKISQACQSHKEDWKQLIADPLDPHNLMKAPVTLLNEALGKSLVIVGEIITPVTDKLSSVARQVLRSVGVETQVASDMVYVTEAATDVYAFKSLASVGSKLKSAVGSGAKVQKVNMFNANKLGSLDDLAIGGAVNSNITRINRFDHVRSGGHLRTPANATSLPRDPMPMTGTHGGNPIVADAVSGQRIAQGSVQQSVPFQRGAPPAPASKMGSDAPRANSIGNADVAPAESSARYAGAGTGVGGSGAGTSSASAIGKAPSGGNKVRFADEAGGGKGSISTNQTSKIHDYTRGYAAEFENFVDHAPKEFNGSLSKPLRVVSYHNGEPIGAGRSLKYWMPVSEANAMGTMEDVINRLAMLNEWGARSHVSVAEISAGQSVQFLHGRAGIQVGKIDPSDIRTGGGVQYRFKEFDESWVKMTKELPK
jgi:hypothetical protein